MAIDEADFWRRIGKIETDIYYGAGRENPSITTRLSLLEDNMEKLSDHLDKIVGYATKGFWLLVTILVTALVNIVLHILGK